VLFRSIRRVDSLSIDRNKYEGQALIESMELLLTGQLPKNARQALSFMVLRIYELGIMEDRGADYATTWAQDIKAKGRAQTLMTSGHKAAALRSSSKATRTPKLTKARPKRSPSKKGSPKKKNG